MHHRHLQPGTLWPAILQRTAHALQSGRPRLACKGHHWLVFRSLFGVMVFLLRNLAVADWRAVCSKGYVATAIVCVEHLASH